VASSRLQSIDSPIDWSWRFMMAMFSAVHLAGCVFLSMAAFSAGRPNASQPMGCSTLKPLARL